MTWDLVLFAGMLTGFSLLAAVLGIGRLMQILASRTRKDEAVSRTAVPISSSSDPDRISEEERSAA